MLGDQKGRSKRPLCFPSSLSFVFPWQLLLISPITNRVLSQDETARLTAELDSLRGSVSSAAAASDALVALQLRHEEAAARVAALEGADSRAAQLLGDNERLRERLERSEAQARVPALHFWLACCR